MKKALTLMTSATLFTALAACSNQKEAESPDDVGEGPMEEAGEWTDEAAEDTADAVEEGADETSDELDDDPATD